MRKIVSYLAAWSLTLALFAGCSGSTPDSAPDSTPDTTTETSASSPSQPAESSSPPGERQTISMWFWGAAPFQREAYQKNLLDAYNNSQDQYTFEIEYRANATVDNDINVAVSAGQGPDIVYGSGPAFVAALASSGKLANLDRYAEQYGWKDRIITAFYEACTVDGSLYSIPGALISDGVFYNQQVLDENGWKVPDTVEELQAIMDEAIAKGMYGGLTGARGWRPTNEGFINLMLNHVAGPEVVYNVLTGKTPWTDPAIKESLEICNEWYQKGYFAGKDYFNLDYNDSAQLFVDGKSPFWFGPVMFYQFIQKVVQPGQEDNFKFIAFPNFNPDLSDNLYAIGVMCSFSINAASKNPDGAAEVLNLMLTPEYAINMSLEWPGYWGMPIKELVTADISGATGLSKYYLEACLSICDSVDSGNFGYAAATFFPPSTFQRAIDIDTVWEGTATVDQLTEEIDKAFQDDASQNLVPPIPAPALS